MNLVSTTRQGFGLVIATSVIKKPRITNFGNKDKVNDINFLCLDFTSTRDIH